MRRKLFTFLVAFLATLSGAVWAETNINLSTSTPTVTGGGASIDEVTKTITIDQAGDYVITGSTTEYQVLIGSTSGTGTVNVTLSDATIELSKSLTYPIRIVENNKLGVNLTIKGENVVSTTGGQAGITVPYGSSMTISGTGILNTSGHCGIGNANNSIASGICGNITISSGTVVANGSAWCIGGYNDVTEESALQSPKLAMTGDALLVVHDDADNRDRGIFNMNYWGSEFEDPNDPGNHPDKGIYCNAKAQAGAKYLVGSLYSDVTLKSPFPSDDFVVDLKGKTLTLGAGSYARINQITGLDEGGTLNAYEVKYNINKPNDLTSVSPITVESMYYGPNAPLTTINPTINPVNTYTYWGWALDNEITSFSPKGNVDNGIVKKEVKAVWVVKERTITTDSGTEIAPFDLVSPKEVNGFSFELIESTTLPSELQLNSNTISGTLNESKTTKYKAKNGGKEEIITLNFDAKNTQIDISEQDKFILSVENADNLVYNGAVQQPNVQVLDVEAGENLTPDVNYTVAYEPSEVKNAGTYKVTVTGKGAYKETLTETFEIQKATARVTAKPVEWTIGTPGPTFTDALTVQGVGEDQLTATCTDPTGPWAEAGVYKVTYTDIELTDKVNYEEVPDVTGKLIVKKEGTEDDPITPGENEDPEIIPGTDENMESWEWDSTDKRFERTYDGLVHPLTKISFKYINEGETAWETLTVGTDCEVSYEPSVPKDVNENGYTATITITNSTYYSGEATINLYINPADLTINLNVPATIEKGQNVSAWWNTDKVEYSGAQNNEKPKIEGTLTLSGEPNQAGTKLTATIENLKLVDNSPFLGKNYTPNWKNGSASVTVEADGTAEIPGDIEVIPDGNGDGDGGDGQDPTKYYNIYDVTEYDFIDVSFSRHVVREGGSVNVYLGIPEGLDPAAVTLMFKRSLYGTWDTLKADNEGNYKIDYIWSDIYVKAVVDESYIDPNPDENHIYIDLSETNDSIWLYTERKLVEEGKTAVIQAEVAKSCQNKEIRYMYKRTVLGEWKEMPKDYSINQYVVRDITTDIYVKAYFVFDKQDPTTAKNPHHVYADITATCEGLYLDATRHKVADEGDTKVFLYVKKGFETKDARYQFKRGLKGEWEDLVPGIEQNTFQVTDIEGDIYLKGIDAVYTGTEDIDGMVRVYTKDGSLFVYTAQPEEISVVSMTGVTVKRTRQTGLQSYPLNQGIYVVRVGEQVFKVRVK